MTPAKLDLVKRRELLEGPLHAMEYHPLTRKEELALIERVEIAEADLRLVLRADVTRLKAAETAYREESA